MLGTWPAESYEPLHHVEFPRRLDRAKLSFRIGKIPRRRLVWTGVIAGLPRQDTELSTHALSTIANVC